MISYGSKPDVFEIYNNDSIELEVRANDPKSVLEFFYPNKFNKFVILELKSSPKFFSPKGDRGHMYDLPSLEKTNSCFYTNGTDLNPRLKFLNHITGLFNHHQKQHRETPTKTYL